MIILEMNCKVCGNTSAKNTSVSFFRFPKENSKCRDWADRCDLLGLFETHGAVRFHKSFRICSQHFHPKDVVFDGRKNKLLDSATPHLSATEHNLSFQLPQNLCRLCAEQDDNVTDIFGWRGRLLNLETKLKYFPQVINKHDILPLKICNQCVCKVNQFYDFILNCTRAETKLRAMLDTKGCDPAPPLSKSDADPQDKPDWDSGMETSSSETPKLSHCHKLPTSSPDNMAANCHDGGLLDSFILARDTEADFPKRVTFDHDYSNQLLPPDDQLACHVCWEALSGRSAAGAHSPPPEYLSELCDGGACSRFPLELACRGDEEEECVPTACVDDESFAHRSAKDSRPCQSRWGSKTKKRTKPGQVLGESCRCGDKFSKKRVRGSHDETHSESSHRCSECGKFFRSKASLRQHRSVHSEKRLHNCRECGMSFKRKDTLGNHLRIHTGERPFMCKVCGFAFKQRGDCVKHENNHDSDNKGGSETEREPRGGKARAGDSASGGIN